MATFYVKIWVQTNYTSTIKMGKLRYINPMKYYAAKIMTKLEQQMNVDNIKWGERRKTKKFIQYDPFK